MRGHGGMRAQPPSQPLQGVLQLLQLLQYFVVGRSVLQCVAVCVVVVGGWGGVLHDRCCSCCTVYVYGCVYVCVCVSNSYFDWAFSD